MSDEKEIKIPAQIPLLPVRDIVVFPHMLLPLFIGREISIKAVEASLAAHRLIFLGAQKALEVENPTPEDIYPIGTIGMIMRTVKLSDGRIKVLIQGITRGRILAVVQSVPHFVVEAEKIEEPKVAAEQEAEKEAVLRSVKQQVEKVVGLGRILLPDALVLIENLEDPGRLADLVTSNLGLKIEAAQEVLSIIDPIDRLKKVNEILSREGEILAMQQKITTEAKSEIDKTQREYFLREQLKAIQKELGESNERQEEISDFRKKIEEAKMPEKVAKEAEKQISRLEKMHPDSAEAAIVRTYLEWMIELPWSKATFDNLDIKTAQKVLDEDHYDLEKVKERILEYLAVRKMKQEREGAREKGTRIKGPILCFVGPPGVGKTSLGKSIARVLGREFVRISLGGVRDEAEIRGHRRTYVGALPGRILQGIKQAGSNNPVFMMDEVDKIGMDFRGDPAAALLEVLDPEQNHSFSDHYLGVPFDLSNVLFITTANLIDPILPALRDRMEVIDISGYTTEEKAGIARNFLIPRQITEHGVSDKDVALTDPALQLMITQYTREAGVRNLEREIANVLRKIVRKLAEGDGGRKRYVVTPRNLHRFLGIPKFLPEAEQEEDEVGVAVGLAWTAAGGDVIFIEASRVPGKGGLTLTGHLGDVMKESAQAALTYIRSREKPLGVKKDLFAKSDVHIHVPAGAIPKDGPSAGITMATALASAFISVPVRRDVAMTGEVTLRGRVLPVGGLKEKILAAKRAGMKTVILPKRNAKDLEEVPPHVKRGLTFVFADHMDEVLSVALNRGTEPRSVGADGKLSSSIAGKVSPPRRAQVARSRVRA